MFTLQLIMCIYLQVSAAAVSMSKYEASLTTWEDVS